MKINDELHSVFFKYLDAYFTNRDLDSVVKMFSPDIIVYGTGFDEKCYSLAKAIEIYERDLSEITSQIHYDIKKLHIYSPISNTGIVSCELDIKFSIQNQEVKLNHLRFSLVFVKCDQKWLITHKHISLPTDAHEGDESYPIKELEEQNNVLQRLVDERTEKLNEALAEISKLAVTDKLTGLFNRLKTEEFIQSELLRSNRYNNDFSIILIDIDHFKNDNDTFGHLAGDKVLVEFSELLSKSVRQTDICGRWGGEEFIIICPSTSLREAISLAEIIRTRIEQHKFEVVTSKTASFGVACYKINDTVNTIMNRADKALYHVKDSGRNQVFPK